MKQANLMTNQHPITPPPELVELWVSEIWHEGTPVRVALSDEHIATQAAHIACRAAQWGADMELEACCYYFGRDLRESLALELRSSRRPKPPSLKEQLLQKLDLISDVSDKYQNTQDAIDDLRRALEALPND